VGINFYLIAKHTEVLGSLKSALIRPLFTSALAVGLPGLLYAVFARLGYAKTPLFLTAVPVTLALYLVLCLRGGLVGETEISMLPKGISKQLTRLCRKTNES
jgi:hypothetical protein